MANDRFSRSALLRSHRGLERLGRAAQRLHRSPPALTKCIRRLEESVGAPLFERAGRGIRLTAAGRVLQMRAKSFDVAMDDTLRAVAAVVRGESGHLASAWPRRWRSTCCPARTACSLASGAGVSIETLIGMSNFLRDALRTGAVDLAISVSKADDEFVSHPIVDDEVVVVAGSGHEIFRKRATLTDLARYQVVLPVASYDTEIRRFVDDAFLRHGLPPPSVQIETNCR